MLREEVIEPTIKLFENMIKVKPLNENWKLLSNICEEIDDIKDRTTMSKAHDFMVFFTGFENTRNKTLAESYLCQYHKWIGKPMVSRINLNLHKLDDYNVKELKNIVKHEMVHSLGFFRTLYGSYIDKDGKYIGHNKIINLVETKDSKKVKYF